jgi:4-diphosphocytidyl-2-C-methyl-D-erythritol kinase
MIAPDAMTVAAPAKINLFLRVLGRRADGYHDIESLVVPISLADRLRVHAAADPTGFRTLSLSLGITGDPGLTRGVPADESNLVLRAARLLAERAGVRGFADLDLDKRIPAAAGLGGGSSDAAAALRALNDLWAIDLPPEDLQALGAAIGSDVPALLANRPVIVSGRGERVRDAQVLPFRVALVTFDFGIRTAHAYGWWDADDAPSAEPAAELAGHSVVNDLEGPVMRRHPAIREARDLLLEAGAVAAVMCGSGPSVAGILPDGLESIDPSIDRALRTLGANASRYARTLDHRDNAES